MSAFSNANWGNSPENGRSMASCVVFLSNALVGFKVGLQGLTAQSTMEAALMTTALAMKEAVFCSNMMKELGFITRFDSVLVYIDNTSDLKELGFITRFDSVLVYIDNTSALHVAGNRTYSLRVKHLALRYFFIQALIMEGGIIIHYVKTEDQLADLGTEHLTKQRQRHLLKLIR